MSKLKIANIELTREKLIVVVSAGAVLVVLAVYLVFYAPLIGRLKKAYSECKSAEGQRLQARQMIESMGEAHEEKILITEKEASQAIDELTKHCGLKGVDIVSINPREVIEGQEAQFKILPIEMEIKATDQQFAAFIGSLFELKKGVIKIRSFDLVPDSTEKTKFKINLVLDMYLANAE